MKNIVTSIATKEDIESIYAFFLDCFHLDSKGFSFSGNKNVNLLEIVNEGSTILLLKDESNQQILAFVYLEAGELLPQSVHTTLEKKFFRGDKFGWISGLLVHPNARGNGLQKFLYSEIQKLAKQKAITFLISLVEPDNSYSINNIKATGREITPLKSKMHDLLVTYKRIGVNHNLQEVHS